MVHRRRGMLWIWLLGAFLFLPDAALAQCQAERDIFRLSGQINQHKEDLERIQSFTKDCWVRLKLAGLPSSTTEQPDIDGARAACKKMHAAAGDLSKGKWPYVTLNRARQLNEAADAADRERCGRVGERARAKVVEAMEEVSRTLKEVSRVGGLFTAWYEEYTMALARERIQDALKQKPNNSQ